jgi:AcrR family transcriptional regulator
MNQSEQAECTVDPRIRRTRQMLRDALFELCRQKPYDQISVQDIAERSTVNRATFYDHYGDKSVLMEDVIANRFEQFLVSRAVRFQRDCPSALQALVLAVMDFLLEVTGGCTEFWRQFEPFVQSAVQKRLQQVLTEGMREQGTASGDGLLAGSMASPAIYGAARYWLSLEPRPDPQSFAVSVVERVQPIV